MRLILFLLFFLLVCLGISACNKPTETVAVKNQPAKTAETASQQIESMLNEAKTELEKKNFGKTIEIAIKITTSAALYPKITLDK